MSSLKNYLSLVKFSHTIFALPFAIIGFFLGVVSSGNSSQNLTSWTSNYFLLFVMVILCMFFARNAAMAFNRWADHKYDKQNPRTKIREKKLSQNLFY